MILYNNCTANLGDFLNGLPVLSGIYKKYGPIKLTIKNEMRKFKGIKAFLMYQGIFESVDYDDDTIILSGTVYTFSSWTREDKNNPLRPTETCRYENFVKDNYHWEFDVDDDFVLKCPELDREAPERLVGDRWDVGSIDTRRETHVLSHLQGKFEFLDYNNDLLTNCWLIKNSKKEFITNLTGVSVLADLLNKKTLVVWKAEDWKPEYRVGDDINWDNGKDIKQIFWKHFYQDRNCRLLHNDHLRNYI